VARPELGTKRVCPTTGRKFYDLNRDPIVSPYTGEVLARTTFEAPVRAAAPVRVRPPDPVEEEEVDPTAAATEVISLEDVAEGEEATAVVDDEAAIEEADAPEDTFLEEEEEGGDDVADLIDGEIEDEEET
jgi:uncharacterized protein (TIGR02300 family)